MTKKIKSRKYGKRIISFLLSLLMIFGTFIQGIPSFAQGGYTGSDIVDSLSVSPQDISHTGNFTVSLEFSGQSENSEGDRYIYPGKEIYIPIRGDGVALAQLNSTLPTIENAEVTADGDGIRIKFLEGIENQYDISGNLRITFMGLNSEEGSTHKLVVGENHEVNVTNSVSGNVGVFAGKTGMMYGESNPGYVTWFLRGNINGDAWPGGPLKIHDKLGDGQKLDGSGINIGLYWGGQQHQTHSKTYSSIEEFLNDPNYGSSAGSTISYNESSGEIDIHIPESVLSEKEFSFTYNALITNHDLDKFTNRGEFDFHENGKPDNITQDAVVTNIDVGGGIIGKTRASININKVVSETNIPISGVKFEVVREDGGPLFQGRDDVKVTLTTDENGQIRARGFRPGRMILKEIDAPDSVIYDPQKEIVLDIEANNYDVIETIENKEKKVEISGQKTWNDNEDQDGKRPKSITVNLLANGKQVQSKEVSETDGWKYEFTNLPKYENGQEITYTVMENQVPEYNTEIKGFDITNSYTPGKTSVSVTKTWDDNNNQDGLRPNSIKVQLYANGEAKGSPIELTEGNQWNHTWNDLAEKTKGQTIAYTVKEVDQVPGYTSQVDEKNMGNIVITNTHKVDKKSTLINKENNKVNKDNIIKKFLPRTGSHKSNIFILIGILVLVVSLILWIKKCKK